MVDKEVGHRPEDEVLREDTMEEQRMVKKGDGREAVR